MVFHCECIVTNISYFAIVVPQFQPRWYPFILQSDQKLINLIEGMVGNVEIVELTEFRQLVFACRVDGRPKPRIRWFFNDNRINITGSNVSEVSQGRSVLTIDLETYREHFLRNLSGMPNLLLGTNRIQCVADNVAGTVRGSVRLRGESSLCNNIVIVALDVILVNIYE